MIDDITKQDALEGALILATVTKFFEGAKHIETRDMTALTAALLETLVMTMSENTDPDTSLQVLSQILLRLAPHCKRGTVHVMHPAPGAKQ